MSTRIIDLLKKRDFGVIVNDEFVSVVAFFGKILGNDDVNKVISNKKHS